MRMKHAEKSSRCCIKKKACQINGLLTFQDIRNVDTSRILALSGSDIKRRGTCTSLRMFSSATTLKLQLISSQTRSRIRLVSKPRSSWFWVTLTDEIYVEESPSASSITFKTLVGLSRSFPVSVFKVQTVMFQEEVKEVSQEAKEGK